MEIVKFLLEKDKMQIYIKDKDESNLIQLTAQSGHYEIFEYLFNEDIDNHSKYVYDRVIIIANKVYERGLWK